MKTTAAVVYEWKQPMVLDELDLDSPREGEVLVQFKVAGICHSDLSVMNGVVPLPPPLVAGHEGAGIVREVGPGVSKVEPGDHVLVAWSPVCGGCYYCSNGQPYLCDIASSTNSGMMVDCSYRLKKGDQPINKMLGVGSFSEFNVINQESILKLEKEIPFEVAAVTGCAVSTGVGAVLRTAKVKEGSSVAVIGIGGVGINVIQGAALANATEIIAVDVLASKLDTAKRFGATSVINSSQVNAVDVVREITGGRGVDYAFEALGRPDTVGEAYGMVRKGGMVVIAGIASCDATFAVPLMDVVFGEKTVKGCYYGSIDIRTDLDLFLRLYKAGKLRLQELITRRYSISEINTGFRDMMDGKNIRGVIHY